jgi:1-hydroxycarotenoid 3,4-desaturase
VTGRVVVVGAGIGGLAAAIDLAGAGLDVTVFERHARPGGKLRDVPVGDVRIDSGPTVLTMRWVFDDLFAGAGDELAEHLTLRAADVLARHAWDTSGYLDLFVDRERSAAAIAAFAGDREARGYLQFCRDAEALFGALDGAFLRAQRPRTPLGLLAAAGPGGAAALLRVSPFRTLWSVLGRYFRDPRLQQLFGRYATYCGSSPFAAPAVLMMIAHAESCGVWLVDGGLARLSDALAALAIRRGVRIRYRAEVESIVTERTGAAGVSVAGGERHAADAVVVNADVGALAGGLLGARASRAIERRTPLTPSLSALTWALQGTAIGFPLDRHNVFFSPDYAREFDELFGNHELPTQPTVYVCAQDRPLTGAAAAGTERLFVLINAPTVADPRWQMEVVERCQHRTQAELARCGLRIEGFDATTVVTTPADYATMFPGTSGALYGPAIHGWRASFTRAGARTRMPRLYLAGGSVHPGPGMPMAALSGRLAAATLLSDWRSIARSRPVAMRGGMSMR